MATVKRKKTIKIKGSVPVRSGLLLLDALTSVDKLTNKVNRLTTKVNALERSSSFASTHQRRKAIKR